PRALTDVANTPRILVLPPDVSKSSLDPRDRDLARSLAADITLTLCKSHLYDVIAPFTAQRLAERPAGRIPVAADYRVQIDLIAGEGSLPTAVLTFDVAATRSGKSIFRHELELRSSMLLDIHYGLC